MAAFDGTVPPLLPTQSLQQGLDEMRQRFVATFAAQCDAIRILVDKVAALDPRGPVAALTQITHRLSGLAGTIGFPTISARASDLENLVAGAGGRAPSMHRPRAMPWTRSETPWRRIWPRLSTARGAKIIIAEEQSDERAIATTSPEGARTVSSIRVLIVDDHAMVRRGLRALLSDEFHGAAFGEAADARQAVEQLRKNDVGCRAARHHPAWKKRFGSPQGDQG